MNDATLAPPRRRVFLLSSVLLIALGALVYVQERWLASVRCTLRHGPRPRLLEVLEHPEAAVALGGAYLRAHPDEADLKLLVRAILPDARGHAVAELRAAFKERVRADLDADDFVEVEGWLLARSEARLFAVAALWMG